MRSMSWGTTSYKPRRQIQLLVNTIYQILRRNPTRLMPIKPRKVTKHEIVVQALEVMLAIVMGKLDVEEVQKAVLEVEAELASREIVTQTAQVRA